MKAYFKIEEFACPHCGEAKVAAVLVDMLNEARERYGKPIIITSGFRCKEHNEAVGGSPTSSHLKGLAVDILCETDGDRYDLCDALKFAGFTRLGIGSNFVHVDIDTDKNPKRIWTY